MWYAEDEESALEAGRGHYEKYLSRTVTALHMQSKQDVFPVWSGSARCCPIVVDRGRQATCPHHVGPIARSRLFNCASSLLLNRSTRILMMHPSSPAGQSSVCVHSMPSFFLATQEHATSPSRPRQQTPGFAHEQYGSTAASGWPSRTAAPFPSWGSLPLLGPTPQTLKITPKVSHLQGEQI